MVVFNQEGGALLADRAAEHLLAQRRQKAAAREAGVTRFLQGDLRSINYSSNQLNWR